MARYRLSDEERAQRKAENVARILAGRPNPTGHVGSEKLWRKLAESALMEKSGRTGDPDLDMFGLSAQCTLGEIKAAYRRLMKELHPDLGGDVELAKAANAAYDRLRVRFS